MSASAVAASRLTDSQPITESMSADEAWKCVQHLECDLTVELPLPGFKIADWLQLNSESVVDSQWQVGADVPLRANGVLIAWAEFEVVANRLAVRVTELA